MLLMGKRDEPTLQLLQDVIGEEKEGGVGPATSREFAARRLNVYLCMSCGKRERER